jgi:hypothetical protein
MSLSSPYFSRTQLESYIDDLESKLVKSDDENHRTELFAYYEIIGAALDTLPNQPDPQLATEMLNYLRGLITRLHSLSLIGQACGYPEQGGTYKNYYFKNRIINRKALWEIFYANINIPDDPS